MNISGQVEQVVSSADCRSAVSDCGGSIPSLPTTDPAIPVRAHIAQSAEHFLGKEEVIGSSPIVGSTLAVSEPQSSVNKRRSRA